MSPPLLSHTATSYGGHGLALLPPQPAGRPTAYLPASCAAVNLIHPRRSLCHDTTARQPGPVVPRPRCDIETRNIKRKERLPEKPAHLQQPDGLTAHTHTHTRGQASSRRCLAQPRPNSNANTTYTYARMSVCTTPTQANQNPPLHPFLLRSRMHASPTWARGDVADAPPQQPGWLC